MPSQGVWGRVRERLQRFPALLASCEEQASIYGKCVASKTAGHGDLKKDVCAKEFQMLMECFTKADSNSGELVPEDTCMSLLCLQRAM